MRHFVELKLLEGGWRLEDAGPLPRPCLKVLPGGLDREPSMSHLLTTAPGLFLIAIAEGYLPHDQAVEVVREVCAEFFWVVFRTSEEQNAMELQALLARLVEVRARFLQEKVLVSAPLVEEGFIVDELGEGEDRRREMRKKPKTFLSLDHFLHSTTFRRMLERLALTYPEVKRSEIDDCLCQSAVELGQACPGQLLVAGNIYRLAGAKVYKVFDVMRRSRAQSRPPGPLGVVPRETYALERDGPD